MVSHKEFVDVKEVMFHLKHNCENIHGKDKQKWIVQLILRKTDLTEKRIYKALEWIGQSIQESGDHISLVK